MKFNLRLNYLIYSIIILSIIYLFIGCYTKVKYKPPVVNNEDKELLYKKQKRRIISELGIPIDSSHHIIYSINSYSELGRSSRKYVINFDGRRKFYTYRNGKRKLINDYYLSPKELQEIQDLFYDYDFKQFPLIFPTSGNPQTIGGATLVAFREKKGDDLIISKRDYRSTNDYRLQHANKFISMIDKIITGRDFD